MASDVIEIDHLRGRCRFGCMKASNAVVKQKAQDGQTSTLLFIRYDCNNAMFISTHVQVKNDEKYLRLFRSVLFCNDD